MGERAILNWPVVYVHSVPVFALPWLYLPLAERRSGLLVPAPHHVRPQRLRASTQPVFFTLGRSYDLTFTPGYYTGASGRGPRARRRASPARSPASSASAGPRLLTEFRYVPSERTRGRATLGLSTISRPAAQPGGRSPSTGSGGVPTPRPSPTRAGCAARPPGSTSQDLGGGFHDRVDAAFVSDGFYTRDLTADIVARENQLPAQHRRALPPRGRPLRGAGGVAPPGPALALPVLGRGSHPRRDGSRPRPVDPRPHHPPAAARPHAGAARAPSSAAGGRRGCAWSSAASLPSAAFGGRGRGRPLQRPLGPARPRPGWRHRCAGGSRPQANGASTRGPRGPRPAGLLPAPVHLLRAGALCAADALAGAAPGLLCRRGLRRTWPSGATRWLGLVRTRSWRAPMTGKESPGATPWSPSVELRYVPAAGAASRRPVPPADRPPHLRRDRRRPPAPDRRPRAGLPPRRGRRGPGLYAHKGEQRPRSAAPAPRPGLRPDPPGPTFGGP